MSQIMFHNYHKPTANPQNVLELENTCSYALAFCPG